MKGSRVAAAAAAAAGVGQAAAAAAGSLSCLGQWTPVAPCSLSPFCHLNPHVILSYLQNHCSEILFAHGKLFGVDIKPGGAKCLKIVKSKQYADEMLSIL